MKYGTALALAGVIVVLGVSSGCEGPALVLKRETFGGPNADLVIRWRRLIVTAPLLEYKPQEFGGPAVDDERVYVGSSEGQFFALRRRDGALVWRRELEGAVIAAPLVDRDRVYIGTTGGRLYAIQRLNGEIAWSYAVKGAINTTPTVGGGRVIFTSGENRVYSLDEQTGAWKWQYDRELPDGFTVRGQGTPLYLQGRVYAGFPDGMLMALDSDTGEVKWSRSLAGDASRFVDVDATPVYYDGVIYVSGYATGVHAIEPRDGSIKWRFDVEGASTVVPDHGRLIFTSSRAGIFAIDRDGRLLWRQAIAKGGELSIPAVLGGEVLFAAADDGLYVADAATGRLRGFVRAARGTTARPAVSGTEAFVLTNAGHVIGLGGRGAAPGRKLFESNSMLSD